MDPIAGTALAVSIIGTFISTAAWRAAHRSARADQLLSQIEADRRHAELTPQFTVTVSRDSLGSGVRLLLHLSGPLPLGRLDEITLTVHEGAYGFLHLLGGPRLAGAPPRIRPTRSNGRLTVGETLELHLHPMSEDESPHVRRRRRSTSSIMLVLKCSKTGLPVWTVPITIAVPEEPRQMP
ncbi:hypothetical protein [Actinomadura sp. NPDC049753]|uniref:hypothetical protein n=1 Tax=Actinomadura sp. NPDC049753 TaxID=3154739 RepID=UPI0034258BE7